MIRNAIVWSMFSLLMCVVALWSCNDDDHKDDVYQSFAYVKINADSTSFSLVTEKGNTLSPTNSGVYINKVTANEWVIATYRDVEGKTPDLTCELLYLEKVLTKPVWTMTTANVDSVVVAKRDAGVIKQAWLVEGADKSFINVLFAQQWVSGLTYVNLVQNNTTVSGTDTIASVNPNPAGGTWTLDFITTYQGGLFLPPQIANGIVSFTVPTDSLANLSQIVINYTDFNLNSKQITVPVEVNQYTFGNTTFDASTPIKEQKLTLE